MSPEFSMCVYCGSRTGLDGDFADLAKAVGTWIGHHRGQLVYGGGNNGLMGIVASAALAAGAPVIGVIPTTLVDMECANRECTELIIVDTMHERKRIMAERSDCFLALPGGIGTMEEFFEIWTWRQLGYHDRPVGLLNANGYYDALLAFLKHSVGQQFMSEALMNHVRVDTRAEPLLRDLVQAAGLPKPMSLAST